MWVLYITSEGEGVLVASTEHRGSWLLSTDVKYFISSVSCLISLRRAAFCFSRSSLSCEGEGSALKINVRQAPRLGSGVAGGVQNSFGTSTIREQGTCESGCTCECVYTCICIVCAVCVYGCIGISTCIRVHVYA